MSCLPPARRAADLRARSTAGGVNSERTRVYGLEHWLERDDQGELQGGRIERGAGDFTLCEDCNNSTGSWYGNELGRAARSAGGVLRQLALEQLDTELEFTWVDIGSDNPRPGRTRCG